MYEVFRDIDSAKVGLINEMLKNEGIQTMLRNWNATNIISIPIPEFYPNICVSKVEEAQKAKALIDEYLAPSQETIESWLCSHCGESVEGNFQECWSCQSPKA